MVDWVGWHEPYDDPTSKLARRLAVVTARLRSALDDAPAGPVRLVSACAGQARDVVQALTDHARRADVHPTLIELDPDNARVARLGAGQFAADVRVADAGLSSSYAGAVPADVLLMCGVFGNISDGYLRDTVLSLPELCAPGATVIWTRHRFAPDRTPLIRQWFGEAGFAEVSFEEPVPQTCVGVHRMVGPARELSPDRRYFAFIGTERWPTREDIHAAYQRFAAAIPGWQAPAAYGIGRVDGDRLEFARVNFGDHVLPAVVLASVCDHANGSAAYRLNRDRLGRAVALLAPAEACADFDHPNLAAWRQLYATLDEREDAVAVFVADLAVPSGDRDVEALRTGSGPG